LCDERRSVNELEPPRRHMIVNARPLAGSEHSLHV
jgi:hypothetical protein